MNQVPNRRRCGWQVWIIRKQRFTCNCVCAANDPIVACGKSFYIETYTCQRLIREFLVSCECHQCFS